MTDEASSDPVHGSGERPTSDAANLVAVAAADGSPGSAEKSPPTPNDLEGSPESISRTTSPVNELEVIITITTVDETDEAVPGNRLEKWLTIDEWRDELGASVARVPFQS